MKTIRSLDSFAAASLLLSVPWVLTAQAIAQPCTPSWVPAFGGTRILQSFSNIESLQPFDDGSGPSLYLGGFFSAAMFGFPVGPVVKWDGVAWHPVGSLPGFSATSLAVFDDGTGAALYAGVRFSQISRVYRWDGTAWSQLGGDFDLFGSTQAEVRDLHVFDDGTGPALYAGGEFELVSGTLIENITRWNGTTWQAVGTGSSGRVNAMVTFDDGTGPALYVGTSFGFPSGSIAKWDGASWIPLPSLFTASTLAVCDHGSGQVLYTGGLIPSLGGATVNHLLRWTGSTWTSVGTGLTGTGANVTALGVFDPGTGPELIVGGRFTAAGGLASSNIARWDGSSWVSMAPGLLGGLWGSITGPTQFATFDPGTGPALFAVGRFESAPATGDGDIAMWGCVPPGTLATNTIRGLGCYSPNPLVLAPLSRPIVSASSLDWDLRVGNVPATAVFGITLWGASDPAILDLSTLGLPGCQLRTSLEVLGGPWLPTGGTFTYGVSIPATPAVVSFELYAQAAVFTVPAPNSFGAITSNGVKGRVGDV